MSDDSTTNASSDITAQVYETFLKAIENDGVSSALVERLKALLDSGRKPSTKALTEALFADDPLP